MIRPTLPEPAFALELLRNEYAGAEQTLGILLTHSRAVAAKATAIALRLGLPPEEIGFIHAAALLHDIGIKFTRAPAIHCLGEAPYIAHGYLGRELVEAAGYPRHALVCERHTGVGLTRSEIIQRQLPLPHREMVPVTPAEEIICYADLFFSKTSPDLCRPADTERIRKKLARFGEDKVAIFTEWQQRFGEDAL